MIQFIFLLVDGRCVSVNNTKYNLALENAADAFEYNDWEEFLDDLNLIEWKDENNRIIMNYKNGTKDKFPLDSPYQLKSFLKIVKTKKPKRQLEEEFDDIDLL